MYIFQLSNLFSKSAKLLTKYAYCISVLRRMWSKVPSPRKRFVLCRYNGIFRPVNNGTNSRLEINLSNYENCEFLVRFYPRLISFFISCGLGNRCRAQPIDWTKQAFASPPFGSGDSGDFPQIYILNILY